MINHRIVTALSLSLLISVPVTNAMQSNNDEQQLHDVGGYVGQNVDAYEEAAAFLTALADLTEQPIPAAADVASTATDATENFLDALEAGSENAESQPVSIGSNMSQVSAQQPAPIPAPFAPVPAIADAHGDNNAEHPAVSPVVSEGLVSEGSAISNHQQGAPAAYEPAEQLQQEELTFEIGSEDAESATDAASMFNDTESQPASMTSNAPQTAPAATPGQPVNAAAPVTEQQAPIVTPVPTVTPPVAPAAPAAQATADVAAPVQQQAPTEGLITRGLNFVRENVANGAAIVRQNPGRTVAATVTAIAAAELARRGVNYLRSNNAITIQLQGNTTISFAQDGSYTCNNAALGMEIEQAFAKVRRTKSDVPRARLALPQDNLRLLMVRQPNELHIGLFYKGDVLQAVEQDGQLLTTVINNNRLSPENIAILNRIAAISRNEQPRA